MRGTLANTGEPRILHSEHLGTLTHRIDAPVWILRGLDDTYGTSGFDEISAFFLHLYTRVESSLVRPSVGLQNNLLPGTKPSPQQQQRSRKTPTWWSH